MSDQNELYFLRRAEAELLLAQQAKHPRAIDAHYELAQSYLERICSYTIDGEVRGRPDRFDGQVERSSGRAILAPLLRSRR